MVTLNEVNDKLIFSSGKEIYVHCGVIGISHTLEPLHGWDSGIDLIKPFSEHELALTNEERKELADYMINLWNRFRSLTDDEVRQQFY